MNLNGIQTLKITDEHYPARLRNVARMPELLYGLGNLKCLDAPCVALVGTRAASPYGVSVARTWAVQLARLGVTVVSGGALGIDTAAHEGALEGGGFTVSVMGTSFDNVFPPENIPLYGRISETGLVLSEIEWGTKTLPRFFASRDRLISALSDAVVVIEAPENSGALITAKHARQQGRPVWVVPSTIDDPNFVGGHALLANGRAQVLVDLSQLLDALKIPLRGGRASGHLELPVKKNVQNDSRILDELPRKVLQHLSRKPKHIDALAEETKLTPQELLPVLLDLELDGLVLQGAGQHYSRKK